MAYVAKRQLDTAENTAFKATYEHMMAAPLAFSCMDVEQAL